MGWRLTPLLRGTLVPFTVCRSPTGTCSCDFSGVMVLECHLIPLVFSPRGSPGYPHMWERAAGGMAVVLLPVPSVLWRVHCWSSLPLLRLPFPQGIYSYSWYFVFKIGLTSDLIHIRKTEKMALSYNFNCNLNLATFILLEIPSLQFITLCSALFLEPNIDRPFPFPLTFMLPMQIPFNNTT